MFLLSPILKWLGCGQFTISLRTFTPKQKIGKLRGCLVCDFKQQFSVFKQHFTHFNVLFHPHVFPQIFSNNNFQFLNTHTKRALKVSVAEKTMPQTSTQGVSTYQRILIDNIIHIFWIIILEASYITYFHWIHTTFVVVDIILWQLDNTLTIANVTDEHEIYTINYSHIYIFSYTFMLFCDWI